MIKRGAGFWVFGLVTAAVVLLTASPASAAGTATISPDHGPTGQTYTYTAGGFKPGSKVNVTNSPTVVPVATADGSGNISVGIAPDNGFAAAIGVYRVRAQGVDPSGGPIAPFAVLTITNCVPLAPSPNCQPPISLPRTGGSDSPRQVVLAVALLLVGAFFVTRKRVAGGHFRPYGAPKDFTKRSFLLVVVGGGALALIGSAVATAPDAVAAGPGSIAGRVTNAAGNVGNVCVRAFNNTDYGAALTAADGTYTISNLANGNYNMAVFDCAAIPTHLTPAPSSAVTVNGAATKDFSLTNGAVFVAKAVRDADSTPIRFSAIVYGATFAAANYAGMYEEGAAVSEPVPVGTYVAGIRPGDDAFPTIYKGNTEDPDTNKVTLAAGAVNTDLSFRFKPAGTISGVVRDATTGQAPTRRICVVPLINGRYVTASAFAATDGSFSFENIGEMPRKIQFSDCESTGTKYKDQYFNAKTSMETADPVVLAPGATKSDVNAAMTSADGTPPTVPTTSTTVPTGSTTTTTTTPGSSATTTTTAVPATTTTVQQATTATTLPPAPLPSNGAATTNAAAVAQGGSLQVAGGGFAPGSPVNVVVYSSPVKLATVLADASGNISTSVTLPSGLAIGTHTLQIQGVTSTGAPRVLERTISVAKTLPRTGALPLELDALVAALAVLGLAIRRVVSARRS